MLKVLKEKFKESELEEPKPEPTTEILFLCSYEGGNKAFPNEGTYRKHAHTYGERICLLISWLWKGNSCVIMLIIVIAFKPYNYCA